MYYLATPYTHYREGIEQAAWEAAQLAGRFIREGLPIYSPIAHSHTVALASDLDPLNHELWMAQNRRMMTRCDGLIVGKFKGWNTSKGVCEEISFFLEAGLPVFFFHPEKDVINDFVAGKIRVSLPA